MKYRFEQFELDREHRSLTRDGEQVPLSAKAFEILCELIANGGEVVSKDELLDRVWPNQFVEENNLTVQMSALRKALGGNGQIIATIPGRGYSFVGHVEKIDDEIVIEQKIVERIVLEESANSAGKLFPTATRARPYVVAALVVIITAIAGFVVYRYFSGQAPKITSVAVLPFTNDTADVTIQLRGVSRSEAHCQCSLRSARGRSLKQSSLTRAARLMSLP